MSVFKDNWNGYNGNSWRVSVSYRDWKGDSKRHEKRGFATKKEALAYEREFIAKTSCDINMAFDTFINIYMKDIHPQIKESTYVTKEFIIDTHIRPYFANKNLASISSTDILQWQNELLSIRDENGRGYSQTYLRSVRNQMNAIMNHAVKYYDLPKNPCIATKKMGRSTAKEMLFWTLEEYQRFSEVMKDKPISYYAFQILYWGGIRCGELLALTRKDFDLESRTLTINKTFQVIKGRETVTSPKTEKSNRIIDLPEFICNEMQDYFDSLYRVDQNTRVFPVTKSYLHHELDRGCAKSGVKRIRLHDLRHSCCALLINLGYAPIQIAQRLGHESVTITERYSHLYPTVQKEMASRLDSLFNEVNKNGQDF